MKIVAYNKNWAARKKGNASELLEFIQEETKPLEDITILMGTHLPNGEQKRAAKAKMSEVAEVIQALVSKTFKRKNYKKELITMMLHCGIIINKEGGYQLTTKALKTYKTK